MPLPPPVQLLLQRFLILLSFIFPAPLTFVPTSSVSPTKFGAAPGVPFAATPAEGCGWNPRASPAQRGAGAVGMEHLWEDSKAAWRAPSGTPGREGEGAPRAAPTAPRGAEGRAWRGGGRGEPRDGGALQLELGALADSIRPLRAELSCLEDDSQRAQQEEWHRSSRGLRRELQSEERRAAHLSHERRRLEARAAEHDVQRGVLRAEIKAAREQPPGSLGPPGDEVEARRRRDELDRMVGCFHAELCEYGTVERGRHGEHETLEREVAALRASLRGHGDLEREVERLRGCLDAHHQLEREVERLRADQHELQGVSREVERLRGCQDAHHQLEREVERLRADQHELERVRREVERLRGCQDAHHQLEREVERLRGCQDAHHQLEREVARLRGSQDANHQLEREVERLRGCLDAHHQLEREVARLRGPQDDAHHQLEREVERLRGCQDAHHQLEREVERLRADQHELQGVSREVERLRGCQDAHHQLEREVERLRGCQDAHHQLEREVERLRSCQDAHHHLEREVERLRSCQDAHHQLEHEAERLRADQHKLERVCCEVERLRGCQDAHHQLEREVERLRGCQDAHHQLEHEVERLRGCQDAHQELEREVERLRSCQHAHQELEYEIERLRGRQGDFPAHGREAGHLERDGQSEARGDVERLGGQQVGQLEREREELELPRGGSARSARSASLSAGARSARSERREQQDDALLREELVGAMALKKRLRAEVGQEAGAEPRARLEEADRAVGVLREARAGLAEAAERAAAALERPPARSCAWPGARRALEARRDPARDVVLRGAGDGIGVSVGLRRSVRTLMSRYWASLLATLCRLWRCLLRRLLRAPQRVCGGGVQRRHKRSARTSETLCLCCLVV
ncbi:unnamed protein product [Prorocentrum cordatum]|uniref:Uncharacterized protein n=1 Tax=Prorocentrum cordatum TaxID=2364126 RepID=A0ABN9R965_9DINO|nr:unnamed protein product [Polarella glacialis]